MGAGQGRNVGSAGSEVADSKDEVGPTRHAALELGHRGRRPHGSQVDASMDRVLLGVEQSAWQPEDEDVIFAGTAKVGARRADVILTIDNSAGLLPIEFSSHRVAHPVRTARAILDQRHHLPLLECTTAHDAVSAPTDDRRQGRSIRC